jgi:protein phosphatase
MTLVIEQPRTIYGQGRRSRNEDSLYPEPGRANTGDSLFMVCDGMGGPPQGDVASRLCCTTVARYFREKHNPPATQSLVDEALRSVFDALRDHVARHPEGAGLGTTFTFLQLSGDSAFLAWCGDSRLYHLREGAIHFRSRDHSLVQAMVDAGELSAPEASRHPLSNVVTRAVTADQPVQADCHSVRPRPGDRFFLCSDGVFDAFDEEALKQLLARPDSAAIARELEDHCARLCSDNYAAYLVTVARIDD